MSSLVANDTLKLYLQDLSDLRPLSKETELAIGRRIAELQELARRFPSEKKIRESQIAHEKQKLVQANLKLVVLLAQRFARTTRSSLSELIAEGNLGLVEAAERFDYTKDCKFSTYAVWWIRLYMSTFASQKSISVPSYVAKLVRQLHAVSDDLYQELEREPRNEEIADRMGISIDKLVELQSVSLDVSSLNARITQDSNNTLDEIVPDTTHVSAVSHIYEKSVSAVLREAMQSLNAREQEILIRHNGLGDAAPESLEAISEDFGISRERVRQIEKRAIEKLRASSALQALQQDY